MNTMKILYLCLIHVTYVCFSRGTDPLPIKYVSCDTDGKLSATLEDSSLWALPETSTCGRERNLVKTSTTFSISGCPVDSDVVVVLTKRNHDTTAPGQVAFTPTKETKKVVLTCNAIKNDVVQVAKLPGISVDGVVTDSPVSKNVTETIHMSMELRATTESSPQVTYMIPNGTYSLLIAGAGNHPTQVIGCTAAPTVNSDPAIKIFPRSERPTVIGPFTSHNIQPRWTTNGEKVNQMASLTGFRLVGSPTVVLKCYINVCAHKCPTRTRSQSVLRKGTTDDHLSKVHSATLKLNVLDISLETSTNGVTETFPAGGMSLKFIVMITTMGFIY